MRRTLWIGLLLVPSIALARGSIRFGGLRGGHGHHGRHGGRSGLNIRYSRKSGHSSFSLHFSGGTFYHRGRRHWGRFPGSTYLGASTYYRAPGVTVQRGWVPYPPGWYRHHVPYDADREVGPFAYVDAVHFGGTGGVQVFGPRPTPAPAPPRAPAQPEEVPIPEEYKRLAAGRLIDRGDELFGRGQLAEAVAAYRAAAQKAPKDPMTAYALGHGLFAVGDYEGAARALRGGLRLYPALLEVPMNRREFYGDPRVFDAQLALLERYVEAHPENEAARFLLGYNLYFSRERGRAREHFAALGRDDRAARLFLAAIGGGR
ncbi:MAG: tetratricopeptide repeat protein [bacterium]